MTDHSKTHADGWRPCEAKGCTRRASGFSRFCPAHRYRTGYAHSDTGRILRKARDLGPYRELVAKYLPQWINHQAIQTAIRYMDSLLADGSTYNGSSGTHRAIAKELRRLRLDGATGEAMLAKVLAVAGYAHFNARTFDDGPCYVANIGHHLTRTTPRPGSAKAPGQAVYEIGREVRETLGPLLVQFWQAVERDVTKQARTRDGIAQALRCEPLA